MRYLIIFALLAALLMAGCAGPPMELVPGPGPEEEEEPVCRTVTEEVPVTEELCEEISYTEETCEKRALEYTATRLPKTDLCIEDSYCVGEPLTDCPGCSKAMTRCILKIKNEDPEKAGTWTVKADYTLGNYGFEKEPITKTIQPGEEFSFDFNQIYIPGTPVFSASCEVYVSEEPVIDDCHDETRTMFECENVTTMETVETEVCE